MIEPYTLAVLIGLANSVGVTHVQDRRLSAPVRYCRNRRADSDVVGRLVAKSQGRKGSLFLEKVGEMCYLFESKGISDLGDIPVGLAEQDLGFLDNAAGNEVGRSLADVFLQDLVEVVDVDG